MRWQQLFADLQAQFDEAEASADRAELASRTRAEVGALRLLDRLRAAIGFGLVLRCRGAGAVAGRLVDVGADWLLLEDDGGRELLVASAAVRSVTGLGRETAPAQPDTALRAASGLRRALRALARDRAALHVVLDDGGTLTGTIDRVGADFVELASHPLDEPRRSTAVQAVHAIAIDAIAVVRTGRRDPS